ncbi:L-aspartate transporter [Serratia fonticola]|uniref:L-aspartate transporter n=1 Tax=Serratia fonticola TaxID=47917 RepID=A0A4U9TTU8_SERFO|nr:L-aspartate transporter [Serratia fonticola]
MGYLLGFITLIAFSSLISIEVVAARQYAAAWFPALSQPGSGDPTLIGWLTQIYFAVPVLYAELLTA